MERMFIRHLSGSKAGSTEQFALDRNTVLSIGRSLSCNVKYSGRRDPLVSRLHAKIEYVVGAHRRFRISDAGSTNGTFVNSAPVRSSTELSPGDVVRLGTRGPEFMFDVRPDAAGAAASISPRHSTVIRGVKTFISGFVEGEEKRSAIALFVRVLAAPVKETMRVALQGGRANPFKYMALGYIGVYLALTHLVDWYLDEPDQPLFFGKIPLPKELTETIETAGLLIVYILSAFVQYRMLSKVSPIRRGFRQFLALTAVVAGTMYVLLGLAYTVRAKWEEPGQLVVLGTFFYWSVQSLRIAKHFWQISYPRVLWYYSVSGIIAAFVYLFIVFVLVFTALFIAELTGHPLRL